jgi:small subunit ribosomal protein S10e
MVLVSTKDRRKLYEYLLQEGVFCCKKDTVGFNDIMKIRNIECFLVMRSLLSRKFVSETFSWQWHYYFLKPEGIKYLREYLGLPESIIPNTHKQEKNAKTEEAEEDQAPEDGRTRGRGGRGGRSRGRGERGGRGRGDRGGRDGGRNERYGEEEQTQNVEA